MRFGIRQGRDRGLRFRGFRVQARAAVQWIGRLRFRGWPSSEAIGEDDGGRGQGRLIPYQFDHGLQARGPDPPARKLEPANLPNSLRHAAEVELRRAEKRELRLSYAISSRFVPTSLFPLPLAAIAPSMPHHRIYRVRREPGRNPTLEDGTPLLNDKRAVVGSIGNAGQLDYWQMALFGPVRQEKSQMPFRLQLSPDMTSFISDEDLSWC
ncbi:hypothetical protein FB45DRAFT_872506 [Roridomyces roridus]|uniref:Uncharacterized protein n=1 Tax=Roridomyces roridus TaxID=1738132 RepID=A0AAD7BE98_9AGAR|nr:hypothetical protein FB45DRAFT_872506 [Roridomyces roridus]